MATNPWLDQEMLDYILTQSGGEFPPAAPGSDILGDQGKYLTNLSKYGNATTDLDTLIAMGALNLGAFDPVSTTDPIEAPGYRQMQEWLNGSPFERYVATAMDLKSPSEIIREVQMMATGETPEGFDPAIAESIANSIPRRINYQTGEAMDIADLQYVQDQVLNLDKLRTQDPDYTLDENGQPVFTTTEESPASAALMEAGYTTRPGETYDPYSFAPEGTFERDLGIAENERGTAQRMQQLSPDYEAAMKDYLGARREQKTFAPGGPADLQADTDAIRAAAGQATSAINAPDLPSSALSVASTGYGSRPMVEPPAPQDPKAQVGRFSDRYEQAGKDRRRTSERAASQSKDYKRAERDNMKAGWAGAFARNDDAMRQAMVQELLRSGRSPFDDERNYRNAIASGGLR